MAPTFALLPDNARCIGERLARLRAVLPDLLPPKVCAAAVIGSVATGHAGDASDIDLLLVLDRAPPRRADYRWWDAAVAPGLGLSETPFPIQPIFIGRASLHTEEPQLRAALREPLVLWDPEALFGPPVEP